MLRKVISIKNVGRFYVRRVTEMNRTEQEE
jgi:hypothetical protein